MNRVESRFALLKKRNEKALIPYIMGGDPDLAATVRLLKLLAKSGADLIEVGVPFSDPLADGPVIQSAGLRALQGGCTLPKLLTALKPVLQELPIPVMLMIYNNMIYQRGARNFLTEVVAAGCAGLIVPDLPPDDAAEMRQAAAELGIALNFLVAPTSTAGRISKVAEASTGFVYAVSLKGVTGARASLPPELPEFIRKVQSFTAKPVAVGFGISTPEQAKTVAGMADGVIVGSAVVKAVAEDPSFHKAGELVRSMKTAICS
jgi:tryptophan synthase alpha chain